MTKIIITILLIAIPLIALFANINNKKTFIKYAISFILVLSFLYGVLIVIQPDEYIKYNDITR